MLWDQRVVGSNPISPTTFSNNSSASAISAEERTGNDRTDAAPNGRANHGIVPDGTVNPFSHKPAFGDPCNGCGACCIITQCVVSQAVFGEHEICPALERAGQAFACGLMINTANYVPDVTAWGGKALTETFTLMIGAGIGCDATLEHEPEPDETARSIQRQRAEEKIAGASPQTRSLVDYFRSPTPEPSHV